MPLISLPFSNFCGNEYLGSFWAGKFSGRGGIVIPQFKSSWKFARRRYIIRGKPLSKVDI